MHTPAAAGAVREGYVQQETNNDTLLDPHNFIGDSFQSCSAPIILSVMLTIIF